MAMVERLNRDQAASVFRRAAELELARQARLPEPGLDLASLEAAAKDAGLSPDDVRQAVAELRAAGVAGTAAATVRATEVVVDGTVDGDVRSIGSALVDFLHEELLELERDLGDRTVWVPEAGIEAAVERRLEGGSLRRVRRLVAAVVEVPGCQPARTHVRLEADVVGASSGLRAGVPVAAGAAAAAAGAAAGAEPAAAGLLVAGAAAGVAGLVSARRARRRRRAEVRSVLAGFLDWVDRP